MTDLARQMIGPFGFGCAGIAGMYQACPEDRAMATLQAAWDGGLRYFDTAPFYGTGLSEQRLGQFLQGKPRSGVMVSSKVGRSLTPVAAGTAPDNGFVGALPALVHFDYRHDAIMRSVEESLTRLQMQHIDILYVHDIGDFAHGAELGAAHFADLMGSGVTALNRLKDEGVIGAWGLGVNEVAVCRQVLRRCPLDVILLAGRYSLLDRSAAGFVAECQRAGLPLVMGGVLNSGILATGAVPGARFNYEVAGTDILARVSGIERICASAGVSLLQAALNFPLQGGHAASVLIGATDPDSLQANLAAARQKPSPAIYDATLPFALLGEGSIP